LQLAVPSALTLTVDSCSRGVDLKRGKVGRSVVLGDREQLLSLMTKTVVDTAR
jgi:hypothetical protein